MHLAKHVSGIHCSGGHDPPDGLGGARRYQVV